MFRASTLKETSGKARVPGNHNKVTLKADETGLRPSDDHTGVCKYSEPTRQTGMRSVPQTVSADDTNRPPTGKRHVHPVHSSNNEATRRVEGRIGVRKCWNASTSVTSRRTWGTEEDIPSSHPKPIDHAHTAKLSSTHTAEQKAERSLARYLESNTQDKGMAERVEKAKKDGTLVQLHQQFERQQRVQNTLKHRDPMSMSPLRKANDLGEKSATHPPFAVSHQDEAPCVKGSKRTYNLHEISLQREADAARKERLRNGVYRHNEAGKPVPFDTNNGEAAYPEPPSFGKSVPFSQRHMGKARPDAMRTEGTGADADTLSIQRAATRAQRSGAVPHAGNPNDFIFGSIPPPSPNKNRSLAESHETKCAINNERPHSSGRLHSNKAYQPTSLW